MENEPIDVIVPVFNEEDGLPEFIKRLSALPIPVHPIFIDNASTDGSLEILRTVPDATIIEHRHNEGYGASLRDGIRRATASKIVIIDADCEYPPEAIPELAGELDRFDAVYASRFLDKHDQTMPFLKMAGNIIISKSYNILFRQKVTDLYTGSKGFRRRVVEKMDMERDGYEHVLEVAARLSKNGVKIHEIPVQFRPRLTGTSKMKHIRETTKFLYFLIYYFLTLSRQKMDVS